MMTYDPRKLDHKKKNSQQRLIKTSISFSWTLFLIKENSLKRLLKDVQIFFFAKYEENQSGSSRYC